MLDYTLEFSSPSVSEPVCTPPSDMAISGLRRKTCDIRTTIVNEERQ